jgi:xanthine dehydrogenase iron-sulfur cluster and FAD-binding subunit A
MCRLLMAVCFCTCSVAVAEAASTAQVTAPAASGPVTTEHYYRIRWGSAAEFKRLYERNHAPLLREMQRQGFILAMRVEEPFTHLSGGARWDLRVTITYRDAASAVLVGGPFDQAFEAASRRLYPDRTAFDAEEARRFSLLEEHWDVIVTPVASPQ